MSASVSLYNTFIIYYAGDKVNLSGRLSILSRYRQKFFVNHKRANGMKKRENLRKTEIVKHKLKFKEKVLDKHRAMW
jgi:hypothetical protein